MSDASNDGTVVLANGDRAAVAGWADHGGVLVGFYDARDNAITPARLTADEWDRFVAAGNRALGRPEAMKVRRRIVPADDWLVKMRLGSVAWDEAVTLTWMGDKPQIRVRGAQSAVAEELLRRVGIFKGSDGWEIES